MSNIDDKLNEYEDFELAFLLKYKASNYMDSSLKKIVSELKNRGIDTTDKIDALIEEKLNIQIKEHKERICPRCTSTKILSNREQYFSRDQDWDGASGKPLKYIEHKNCGVCGWDFQKDFTKNDKRKRTIALIKYILFILLISAGLYLLEYIFNIL